VIDDFPGKAIGAVTGNGIFYAGVEKGKAVENGFCEMDYSA